MQNLSSAAVVNGALRVNLCIEDENVIIINFLWQQT